MGKPGYATNVYRYESKIQYFFISKGKQDIVKAIEYSHVGLLHNKKVFNLGFGDYDIKSDKISDGVITDNGDV